MAERSKQTPSRKPDERKRDAVEVASYAARRERRRQAMK